MLVFHARGSVSLVKRSCCVSRGFQQRLWPPALATRRVRCLSTLLDKKCVPCESDKGSLGFMGLCEALDRKEADSLIAEEVKDAPAGSNSLIALISVFLQQQTGLSIVYSLAHQTPTQAEGWELAENEKQQLLIRRTWRTKNFVKVITVASQLIC